MKRVEVEVNEEKVAYQPAKTTSRSSSKSKKKKTTSRKNVTVRNGDTLSAIAKRNHTTVDKLKRLNGIKGSNIRAGKKIRVK